ncbi:hypothetical protein QFC19_001104 [Naganishia cerealis]|uniref:Uncharacterized protein n=1 Tax=Naganishia cerealis TaxID=610337 RepID=A0ACC2WJC1_9TREE|nr:hypothetical protein QFC19_001104 [Naganishia cerealis]
MSAQQKRKPAPVARKSSATIPKAQQPTTFYAGPTVPKKGKVDVPVAPTTAEAVTGQSKVNVEGKNLEQIVARKNLTPPSTLAVEKRKSPNQLTRNVRSHRLLNSTILFVLLASLFSLYACPPPNSTTAEPSIYTKLNPFIATPHLVPDWESYICKPTNTYRTKVLEPYVVPHVKNRIRKVRENPIVRNYIEPVIIRAQAEGQRLWKTRLERPLKRGSLVAHQLHGRYIAPTYPVLKARFNRLVAYIRYQLDHAYATVSKIVTSHPTYAKVSKRVAPVYQTTKSHVINAYHTVIPHVHRARKTAQPHVKRLGGQAYLRGLQGVDLTRANVIPRIAKSLEVGLDHAERIWESLAAQLKELYATRVYPLFHPHYSTVEPHVNRFTKEVYNPYLRSPIKQARPLLYSLILTPSYADIRRAIRAGYLDTRAAVEQGVESVKDTIHAAGDKVESVVDDVKAKVVPSASSASASVASAIKKAQHVAEASATRASASASSGSRSASVSVHSVTDRVVNSVAAATASVKSYADQATHSASSVAGKATDNARNAASDISVQAEGVATSASGYAKDAVEAARSAASHVSASGSSVINQATKSVGSVASKVSQNAKSAASDVSASVHSGVSQVSSSGSSVIDHATQSVMSASNRASQEAGSAISRASASGTSIASHASVSAGSAASQVSSGIHIAASQVSHTGSHVAAQASQSVESVSGVAKNAASSAASRVSQSASSVVDSNVSTLDPLDPTATVIGSNPGKTTVPHNPDSDQVAPFSAEEGVTVQEQIVQPEQETTVKDPTHIKQQAAAAVHAYLQEHVPKIAQNRLSALEHEAVATTRAFEQLLGQLELTPEAEDVSANRAKVKASLKKVRSKLDEMSASLEAELRGGLITAGASEQVDKLIDTAVRSAGSSPSSQLRQSYKDVVQSVLDTLNHVNDAVAREGQLLLKPYRKEAKDRADQALDLLDGKATAAVVPTGTVGQVAKAAAGTIGRAKDQIIADIKQATEAGSSMYQSVTDGAGRAAGTAASRRNLDEQADAVLEGLSDFRNAVNEKIDSVTKSGKAGAASATQAIKDEL